MEVSVTDVNERPHSITPATTVHQIAENSNDDTVVITLGATDPDGGSAPASWRNFVYTLGGAGSAPFKIVGNQVQVNTSSLLDFESQVDWAITVTVANSFSTPTPHTVRSYTVRLTDVNERPHSITPATTVHQIPENSPTNTVAITLGATDPDGGSAPANWRNFVYTLGGAGSGPFVIVGNEVQVNTSSLLDFESQVDWAITVTVANSFSTPTPHTVRSYTVRLTDVNERPHSITPATTVHQIPENSNDDTVVITLGATDPDGGSAPASWRNFVYTLGGAGSAPFKIVDDEVQVNTSSLLDFESQVDWAITVTVANSFSTPTPHTVRSYTVRLTDVNERPHSITPATTVHQIAENSNDDTVVITLGATDPDGGSAPASWRNFVYTLGGAGSAPFKIVGNQVQVNTSSLLDFESQVDWAITVTVANSFSTPTPHTVRSYTVRLTDVNERPVFSPSPSASLDVDEHPDVGFSLGSFPAVDPDATGSSISYSLSVVPAPLAGRLVINSTGHVLVSGALDYEQLTASQLAVLTFDVTVTATETSGGLSSSHEFSLEIVDVNEAVLTTSPLTIAVAEGSTGSLGPVLSTGDVDHQGPNRPFADHEYSYWTASPEDIFDVSSGGQISLRAPFTLDFERFSQYFLELRVADLNGAPGGFSSNFTVQVNVSDVDEPPHQYGVASGQPVIPEDATIGAFVFKAVAVDPEGFSPLSYSMVGGTCGGDLTVNSTGNVTVASALSFSASSLNCTLVIRADDASLFSTHTYQVSVTDVDQAPTLQPASYEVDENTANGTIMLQSSPGSGDVSPQYDDPDLAMHGQAGDTALYTLTQPRQDVDPMGGFLFRADPLTGGLRTNTGLLNYEQFWPTAGSVNVTMRVSDRAGLTGTTTVTIYIRDQQDAPTFNQSTYLYLVQENPMPGTVLGQNTTAEPVDASDEDAGQTGLLEFSIAAVEPAAGTSFFAMHPQTGEINVTLAGSTGIDLESYASFNISVRVRDPDGLEDSATVRAFVGDLPEPPTYPPYAFVVDENSPVGTPVGVAAASDEDAGTVLTYAIVDGNAEDLFRVDSATGAISVKNDNVTSPALFLNFERRQAYNLTLRVTDNTALAVDTYVSISVIDRNDYPVYTSAFDFSVLEHSPLSQDLFSLVGSDEDDEDVLSFAISSGNDVAGLGDAFQVVVASNRSVTVQPARDLNYEDGQPRWYFLEIRITDDDGGGKGPGPFQSTVWVNVTIVNIQDRPVLPAATLSLAENAPPGSFVGQVLGTDEDIPEQGQTLSYSFTSLSDPAGLQRLAIDPVTAVISVLPSVDARDESRSGLNFELNSTIRMHVVVWDDDPIMPLNASAVITVELTDVNERPMVLVVDQFMAERSPPGTLAADNETAVYSLMDPSVALGASPVTLQQMLALGRNLSLVDPDTQDPGQSLKVSAALLFSEGTLLGGGLAALPNTSFANDVSYETVLYGSQAYSSEPFSRLAGLWGSPSCFSGLGTACGNNTAARGLLTSSLEPQVVFNLSGTNEDGFGISLFRGELDFEARNLYQFAVFVEDEGGALGSGVQNTTFIYNLHVVNINEPATLQVHGTPSASENSQVGVCLNDFSLLPVDPDDQLLIGEIRSADLGAELFFTLKEANSTLRADGSRDSIELCVSRLGLPTGQQTVEVRMFDPSDGSKSSVWRLIVITVNDVNDRPELRPPYVAAIDEQSPVGTPVLHVIADDNDVYQNLNFVVEGDLVEYFSFEPVVTPLRSLNCTNAMQLSQPYNCTPPEVVAYYTAVNGGPFLNRSANLVVALDALDYEAMQAAPFFGQYSVAFRVTDVPFITRDGIYFEDEEEPELSRQGLITVSLQDIFDPPSISSVTAFTPFGLTTAGGESVTITGNNFGPARLAHPALAASTHNGPVVAAQYTSEALQTSFNTSRCEVVVAYTSIQCFSQPGFGAGYAWRVFLGGGTPYRAGVIVQVSEYSLNTTRYAAPNVVRFLGPGHDQADSSGGQLVIVEGSQFGTVAANRVDRVTYGPLGVEYEAKNCRVVVDHSVIHCTSAAGVGAGLRWVVNIAGLTSQTPTTNYAPPTISSVQMPNGSLPSTEGGAVVRIIGENFGAVDEFPPAVDSVRYGYPDHRTVVVTGTGNGTRRLLGTEEWEGGEPGWDRELFSSISTSTAATSSTLSATDSRQVPLLASPYAVQPSTVLRSDAFTATDCLVVVNHTVIECTLAAGAGADLHVQVSIRGQPSAVSNVTVRYAPPRIDSIFLPTEDGDELLRGSTRGGSRLTLQGENFGRPQDNPRVFFGVKHFDPVTGLLHSQPVRRQLPSSSVSPSLHSELRFDFPGGHGDSVDVWLKVKGQVSQPISTFGFEPPKINSLERLGGALADLPIRLKLIGQHFGACCFQLRQRLEAGAAPAAIAALQDTCACLPGEVESIQLEHWPAEGGAVQTVPCNITSYAETEVECNTTVISGNLTITVGGQVSDPYVYRFSDLLTVPIIEQVSVYSDGAYRDVETTAAPRPTSGLDVQGARVPVQIKGRNFGLSPGIVHFMYYHPADPAGSEPPHFVVAQPYLASGNWWTDTIVRVLLPEGQGRPVIKVFFPDAQNTFALYDKFQYTAPNITSVAYASGPSNGYLWLTHRYASRHPVTGVAVDAPLLTIRGTNLGKPLELSPSDALLPGGESAGVQYQGGQLLDMAPSPTGEAASVSNVRLESVITVGGKQCLVKLWTHSIIQCAAPPGVGVDLPITLWMHRRFTESASDFTQRMFTVNVPGAYSYDPPSDLKLSCSSNPATVDTCSTHGPTQGGMPLFVHGRSFGPPGNPSTLISIDGTAPQVVQRLSHNLIRFETPPGEGRDLAMMVSVEGQSAAADIFHYDPPVIECISNETHCVPPASTTLLNAMDTLITINGRNFGLDGTKAGAQQDDIFVNGLRCAPSGQESVFVRPTQLQCRVRDLTVGNKSLTIQVAGQQVSYSQQEQVIRAVCPTGFFGSIPQVDQCTACPQCRSEACEGLQERASICSGGLDPPVAAPGYWRLDLQDSSLDLALFDINVTADGSSASRWQFTRCEPAEACLEGNTCAYGYTQAACSVCLPQKYQRNLISGVCEPCPDNAGLYTLGIILLAVVLGAILYKLYKKGPSVAALGIAVDYLQILSVFGSLNLQWPASVQFVFQMASASAASVETASPECSVELGYIRKWFLFMGLPAGTIAIFLVLHCLIVFAKSTFLKKKGSDRHNLYQHVPGMIGFVFMMLSFMYISLTAKAFEALECKEVGGVLVLAVDSEVLCKSASYANLRSWAFAAVFAYGLGIPALFAIIIFRTAARMKADQALRIQNLSGSRETNPFYDFQKRYKRLYFKFKPTYYYWILVILARKFMIVVIAAQMKARPMMAATTTVVVLFAACIAQLTNMPYRQHETQSKEEAVKTGALGSDIPPALLALIRQKQLSAATERAAAGRHPAGAAPGSKASKLLGAGTGDLAAIKLPAAGGALPRAGKRSSKGVAVHGRGVDLKHLASDGSVLWANDPRLMQQAVGGRAGAGSGTDLSGGTPPSRPTAGSVWFRASVVGGMRKPMRASVAPGAFGRRVPRKGSKAGVSQTPTGKATSTAAAASCCGACTRCGAVRKPQEEAATLGRGGSLRDIRRRSAHVPKQATTTDPKRGCCMRGLCAMWSWVMSFGTASNAKDGLQLREESRKGGKVKVKVKYLFNYNLLEATFLVCAVFVLLSGVMFRTADSSGELDNPAERVAMEVGVMVIIVGSTVICLTTVLAELALGMQYTLWAGQLRRKREKEYKRQKRLEKSLLGKAKVPACAVWCTTWCGCCPTRMKQHPLCRPCFRLPFDPRVTAAAVQENPLSVAHGKQAAGAAGDVARRRRNSIKIMLGMKDSQALPSTSVEVERTRASRGSITSRSALKFAAKKTGNSMRDLMSAASTALRKASFGSVSSRRSDATHTGRFSGEDGDSDRSNVSSDEEDEVERQIREAEEARAGKTSKFGSRYEAGSDTAASSRSVASEASSASSQRSHSGSAYSGPRDGAGVVRQVVPATPEEFQHMKSAKVLSVTEAQIRRQAIMQRLRAVSGKVATNRMRDALSPVVGKRAHHPELHMLTGRSTAGAEAAALGSAGQDTAALSSQGGGDSKAGPGQAAHASTGGPTRRNARRITTDVTYSAEAAAELGLVRGLQTTDPIRLAQIVRLQEAQSDPLIHKLAVGHSAARNTDVTPGAAAALQTASKYQNVSRYIVSIHLDKVWQLRGVSEGTPLRVVLKLDSQAEKVAFTYRPNVDMRIREMRLPVFNPDTDSVIGTLYAAQNFVPGAVAHKVAEDVVGHFTFNVSELPNPLDNPERIQMQFGLMAFDGAIAGYISFLMKAQHRGAVVDDWTDMRMGARHYGMVPEPSEEARAAARRAGLRASRAGGKSGAAIAASDAAAHAHLGRYVVQDDGDVAFAVGLDEDGADKRLSWLPGSSGDGAGGKDDLDGPVLRTKGRSSSVQRLASNPMLAARASTASVAPPSAIVPPARSAVDSSTATMLAAASAGSMGNTTKGRAANTVIATSHRSLLAARQRHSMLEGEKGGGGSRRASRRRPSLAKEANQASLRGMLGLYAKAEVEEFGTEDGGTDLQPFEERGRAGSAFSVSSNPLQGGRKSQSSAPANPAPNRASDTLPQPATVLEAASRSAPQGKQAPRHPELAPSLPADMPSSGGLNPLAMLNVFAPSRRDSASARRQFGLGQRASAKAAGTSAHDGRSRTRRTQGTAKGSAVAAGGPGYTSGAALHRMRGETAEQAEQAVGMDVALASALASGVDESGGLFGSSQVDVSSATKPPRVRGGSVHCNPLQGKRPGGAQVARSTTRAGRGLAAKRDAASTRSPEGGGAPSDSVDEASVGVELDRLGRSSLNPLRAAALGGGASSASPRSTSRSTLRRARRSATPPGTT